MQGNPRRAWRLRGKHNDDSEKENGVKRKPAKILNQRGFRLVGAARFELATTCTPCRYATRLRYAPTEVILLCPALQLIEHGAKHALDRGDVHVGSARR